MKSLKMLLAAPVAAFMIPAIVPACGAGESLGVKYSAVLESGTTGKHLTQIVAGGVILTPVTPPQGGTVTIELQYSNTRTRQKWHYAGRKTITAAQLQRAGVPVPVIVDYPYLHASTYWRVYMVWDGVAADGTPDSGRKFFPGSGGKKLRKP